MGDDDFFDEILSGEDDDGYTEYPYKVGDRVVIVDSRQESWNQDGFMDKYAGTVMTIREIDDGIFSMEEDQEDEFTCGGWTWYASDIECLEGDIVPEVDPDEFDEFLNILRNH